MKNTSIAIVGAGIGGLTAAIVLKQHGLQVRIYESAPEIKPVGAGIAVASNAMQLYKNMGMAEKISQAGTRISRMVISDQKLREISAVDLTSFEKKYGVSNIAIHRAALQKLLADELKEELVLAKKLVQITSGEKMILEFEDGEQVSAETVIGADGIHSRVRSLCFGDSTILDAGQRCWRGVCENPFGKKYLNQGMEAWGPGKRFGFVNIGAGNLYWYAVINTEISHQPGMELENLYTDFHENVTEIIRLTPKDTIHYSPILQLKPVVSWQHRKICLIGDAAHAMTPNLGQGACQAIEDAYAIGKLVGSGMEVQAAFSRYEKIRKKRVEAIVSRSRWMGEVSHISNPLGIKIRNGLMRLAPAGVFRAQMADLFNIDYFERL